MLRSKPGRPIPPFGSKLLNIAMYQIGWFCCVLGAAWDHPFLGASSALLLIGVHLALANARKAEIRMILVTCLLGVAADSLQQAAGVFAFKIDPAWPLSIPLWVPVIWAQFATLFHYALHWLSGRYRLAALLGMVGGPLAYGGGVRLGAAILGENTLWSIASLAILWSLLTPSLVWLSDRTSERAGGYRTFF